MVAQVRQGQATVFQVAYAWLLARLGELKTQALNDTKLNCLAVKRS